MCFVMTQAAVLMATQTASHSKLLECRDSCFCPRDDPSNPLRVNSLLTGGALECL